MKAATRWAAWLAAFAIVLIAGCAHPTRATGQFDPQDRAWIGRLALQVQDNQAQSFSAGFELRGRPEAGELTLFTPLGGVAAALSWEPGGATLKNGANVQRFESVDAVVTQATGSAIPVAALFDWLEGKNTQVPGWQADLSQLADGRLRARRMQPPPAADLRVVFDR